MQKIVKEDVSVKSGIISAFQRMPNKLERVFAEFIDNSTQSFFEHRTELIKVEKKDICRVNILWDNDKIIIADNAYGMNHDDFKRALRLNSPREKYADKSRSQYGMGLKTAAVYLGDWYSIETTQLGSSEKYYSEIDVEEWRKSNPTEVDNTISETFKHSHFTKITIKKLQMNLTVQTENTLRKRLVEIYRNDLLEGKLEVIINNVPLQAEEPELRINEDTGSDYLSIFEDSFEFNGVEYNYEGWIGILKTGNNDDAGFTLMQYGRGIMMHYRPTELFGKSNSFQHQRIVGEINLDEAKWKISFNKNNFVWEDGLEKAFIESLKKNVKVKEMLSISKVLRKEKKVVVSNKDVDKKDIAEKYKNLSKTEKKTVPLKEKTVSEDVLLCINTQEENIVPIEWESIQYKFDIQINNSNEELDWFTLKPKPNPNEYFIILNGLSNYFQTNTKKESKKLIIDFAILLALSQLSSVRMGLKLTDSSIMINKLNEIIQKTK